MSFSTFYYLPSATDRVASARATASPQPKPSSPQSPLSSSSQAPSSHGAALAPLRRRPLRVTPDAAPELIELLIRAVDFQLPEATRHRPAAAAAKRGRNRAASPESPATTTTGTPTSTPPTKTGFLSRFMRPSLFASRAASPEAAAAAEAPPNPTNVSTPSETCQNTAEDEAMTIVEPVVRAYLHFPGLDVASRPDDPRDATVNANHTKTIIATVAPPGSEAESTSASSLPRTRAQRVAQLVRRVQQQLELVVRKRQSRHVGSQEATTPAPAAAEQETHKSPSLHGASTQASVSPVTAPSPTAGESSPLVVIPPLRLPHSLASLPRATDTSSRAMSTASSPMRNWTVASCDPWQAALRRAGPDEVGMELRIRAYRTIRTASDKQHTPLISDPGSTTTTTTTIAASAAQQNRRAPSLASSAMSRFTDWLSPVLSVEPVRTVPLVEWVVPIIQTAHPGVTFMELDPYSNVFVPVTTLPAPETASDTESREGEQTESDSRPRHVEAPTRKLFCDSVADVRAVIDFISDTFYDSLALETFHLREAAAAAGPGAVAEIELDAQITHKKAF